MPSRRAKRALGLPHGTRQPFQHHRFETGESQPNCPRALRDVRLRGSAAARENVFALTERAGYDGVRLAKSFILKGCRRGKFHFTEDFPF